MNLCKRYIVFSLLLESILHQNPRFEINNYIILLSHVIEIVIVFV